MQRHALTWVVLFAVIAAMFIQLPQMAAKQDSVIHTYSTLIEVDALAKQRFVESIEDERLVDGAIRGMMLKLDPYSGYIAPDELAAFERRVHGDFIGVGVELGIHDGHFTIIAPLEGGPAALSGVLPGDQLLAIDGVATKGLSLFDIEEMLTGRADSRAELRLQRAGHEEPVEITVLRGPVAIGTVRGFRRLEDGTWDHMLDPDDRIGYVRVSTFCDNTMRDFDAALEKLVSADARGLILDLRFNPGGLMQQAVEMVDRFLRDGAIVSTVTRRKAVHEYHATDSESDVDFPVVILINEASASSSEIVAGALQDHGRAVIVGERSFGKGSVQHLIPLNGQKAAVKLTVAYYRLPSGRIIHRQLRGAGDSWGVKPDVEVRLTNEERKAVLDARRILDLPPSPRPVTTKEFLYSAPLDLYLDRQFSAAREVILHHRIPRGSTEKKQGRRRCILVSRP
ncbi:MAG: S41 family peptidase [Planctomycetota bacterium]